MSVLEPTARSTPSARRRRRLLAQAAPERAEGVRRRARARRRSVRHHARRPHRGDARARARYGDEVRTVIAGYHWFTDWGRDTMISLEGLTLATGRHVEAGYILRTFAHYVRDGLIPNMFPEGEKRRASITPPTPRCGSSTRSTATSSARGDRLTLALLLSDAEGRSSTAHLRGTRFGIDVDPARRPAAPGRAGLSAHLDGRQGRRLGRDAAARQGGRDQRALVQRAAPDGAVGASERRRSPAPTYASAPIRRARRSTSASGTPSGGYLYDVVDGEAAATIRRAGRTRCSRSRCRIRCSTRERWEPVMRRRARSAADAGRPALAGARRRRTTSRAISAICARATPPITRARCGAGWSVRSSTRG